MSEHINLLHILRKYFSEDRICMFYNGNFDDFFTDKLISLADYDISKKAKRRMALLMSESFQNIIRHSDQQSEGQMKRLFGIRGIDPFLHIFSSNLVNREDKEFLENKLNFINDLDKEKLKEYYTKVLNEGIISEKGGAGLGLIEMAKRSERPVQVDFKEVKEDTYAYNLQVDLPVDFNNETDVVDEPLSIQDNTTLYDLILFKKILFLYKGDFSDNIISPLLKILEHNTENNNNSELFKLYHIAVELIQNVSRHGLKINDKNNGAFYMKKIDGGYYLCTGNYISSNYSTDIIDEINKINVLNKMELDNLYRDRLKESLKSDKKNAGVGLIDMRRTLMTPIEVKLNSDKNGDYLIMGVKILFNGK